MRTRTTKSALIQKRNVIRAVMLRDIRTRFFNHGLGYLLVPLWPLVHLVILLAISHFMHRAAPYGEETPSLFFATGLVPTLAFMYVTRFMGYGLNLNKPLLHFPVVKPIDIMTARAILEILAACVTLVLINLYLIAMGDYLAPYDLVSAVEAYATVIFLAYGVGTLVGVISALFPPFATIYGLSLILIYIGSGSIFVANRLPDAFAIPLSYNPILICVEWVRTAYYPAYSDRLVDKTYALMFAGCALCLALTCERVARRYIIENK